LFCEGGASLSPQALALAIKGFPLASKSASTPPPRLAPSAQEKAPDAWRESGLPMGSLRVSA